MEALFMFSPGVLASVQVGVDPRTIASLCLIFLFVRIIYVPIYIIGFGTTRTFVWWIGFVASLQLLLLAAAQANELNQ
jgi:uncharacterized MAPEG superfamily protein